MDVLARVRATIDAHGLLQPGSGLVVAVSGGPDSLCLLHVLRQLHGDYQVRLHVAHLDHGLRPEAAADAAFVAKTAQAWGIPYSLGHADVRAQAAAGHRSLEEAARLARYRFLAEVARTVGAAAVAVGHNADDQVETVLMHCLRGAGLAGLRGMRRRAPWPADPDFRSLGDFGGLCLIRPLLDVPREAIEAYLREQGLSPRLDVTNLELTFYRNRIRHELVPLLETYNPRIRELLHRSADLLADDYDDVQHALDAPWPALVLVEGPEAVLLRRAAFRELAPSLQRSALRRAVGLLRRSLRDLGAFHVEQARVAALQAPAGSTITLPAGLVLEVGYDRLTIRPAGPPAVEPGAIVMTEGERALPVPGTLALAPGGWVLEASWREGQPAGDLCLDADRVGRELRLRTRRPGDRFQPLGMQGRSQSVKDYMINAKIPRAERDRIPLLVSERGILWIVGHRASEIAAPGPQTRRYLCLRLTRGQEDGFRQEHKEHQGGRSC